MSRIYQIDGQTVDLDAAFPESCSCGTPRRYRVPCRHMIVAERWEREAAIDRRCWATAATIDVRHVIQETIDRGGGS